MATRREKVIVEAEDRFTAELARMAAAARMFDKELSGLNTRTAPGFSQAAASIDRDAGKVGNSIDRLSGRLHLLAQSAAALGPALVPATTAAVPAIAGLTTQLGFAIAAAGTTVLAFQGVGDALETMNKAQLEPTEANLEKAREAMEKLSPAALQFVVELREMIPAFRDVRDAASEGLFPGLTASLDDVEAMLPRVSAFVGEIASATGALAEASAESLAGDEWEEFFAFLQREARPTISRLGATVGNLTKGLAEMWMAFDPLSDDFQDSLLSASETFESWAENLSETEGFAEFLAYIRETGPQVMETVGSIADALLQVAEAAAPLGGPVLRILEAMADAVAAIANSPIGTPILGAISAMSALNLATTAFKATADSTFGTKVRGGVRDGVQGFTRDLDIMASTALTAGAKTERQLARTADASDRLRTTLGKGALVAGGAVAGFAALETGIIGTNTALGAAAGSMVGPWGTAAGATVGLLADLEAGGDGVARALDAVSEALDVGGLKAGMSALAEARAEFEAFGDKVDEDFSDGGPFGKGAHIGAWKNMIEGWFGDSDIEEARAPLVAMTDEMARMESVATDLAIALGSDFGTSVTRQPAWMTDLGAKNIVDYTVGIEDMEAALVSAKPAMDALGISLEDLAKMDRFERAEAIEEILAFAQNADSDAGRVDVLRDAIEGLGTETQTTAEAAAALSTALDALLDPQLNLSEATDQWRQGLADLREELHTITKEQIDKDGRVTRIEVPGSRSLVGDTDGARVNREVIRQRIEDFKDLIDAEAAAGANPDRLKNLLASSREELIKFGDEAGLSRQELEDFATQMGLTPQLVEAAIELTGIPEANHAINRLTRDRIIKVSADIGKVGANIGSYINNLIGNVFDRTATPTASRRSGDQDSYWSGGHTGHGGKYEPAGIVHRQEYVFSSEATRGNERYLDNLHRTLRGYANGGLVSAAIPAHAVIASPMGSGVDLDQLAALILAARPLYGDVHVNGDPTSFRQQMQADARAASRDGIKRGSSR